MAQSKAVYPQFFDAHRLGQSLKEVSSDLLQVEAHELVGRWFHANEDIDLFIWTDEKKCIVKQQLTFLGQVVEWNAIEGTRTGVIIEDEEANSRRGAETIQFDDAVQPHPLGLAMDLIRFASALSKSEQKQIIANFFRGQKYSKVGSKELAEWMRARQTWSEPRSPWLKKLAKLLRWLIKPLQ